MATNPHDIKVNSSHPINFCKLTYFRVKKDGQLDKKCRTNYWILGSNFDKDYKDKSKTIYI